HGLMTHTTINPFKKTSVIPPKRASKTINGDAIQRARNWLISLVGQERCTHERSQITPAWFWLSVFELFYYTGIRLNALLCLRYKDIDWDSQMILVRGETEKTHREFFLPIMEGLAPHLSRILGEAEKIGFSPDDQLFNVNRFSRHFHGKEMNIDQVESMYGKLTDKIGVRMTPHRFRHTLATDLM
ncbi:site-specific integrase, partial [Acinetobacter baumannii]|uniref:site-specific integrase n=1 Tax=Acinetobacter baumannii TaxID=470 RepID=UPI00227B3C1E